MYYCFRKIYIGCLSFKKCDECYAASQNIICTVDKHGVATDLLTGKQYNFYDYDYSALVDNDMTYVSDVYEGNHLFHECAETMGKEFIFSKKDLYRMAKLLCRHIDIMIPSVKENVVDNKSVLVKK